MKKLIVLISSLLISSIGYCGITSNSSNKSGTQAVSVDNTNVITTIDQAHYEIHEGNHYYVVGSSALANGQIVDFLLKTPPAPAEVHLTFDFTSTAGMTAVAYGSSTWETGGTVAITPVNSNRQSSNSSACLLYKSTGTGLTTGNLLDGPWTIGASGNPNTRYGGATARDNELILDDNVKYIFRFTNSTDANTINFRAFWYEE